MNVQAAEDSMLDTKAFLHLPSHPYTVLLDVGYQRYMKTETQNQEGLQILHTRTVARCAGRFDRLLFLRKLDGIPSYAGTAVQLIFRKTLPSLRCRPAIPWADIHNMLLTILCNQTPK